MLEPRQKYLLMQMLTESLTDEEELEFETLVNADLTFRNHVMSLKIALQREAQKRPERPTKPRFRFSLLLPLGIAAAIALMIFAYLHLPEWTSSPEERWLIYADKEKEPEAFVKMGSADELTEFGELFNAHRYKEALSMNFILPSSSAEYGQYQFSLGICYMRSKPRELDKAEQAFVNARASLIGSYEWNNKVSAYLACTYAGQGKWADCKRIAEGIDQQSDLYKTFNISGLIEEANKHL